MNKSPFFNVWLAPSLRVLEAVFDDAVADLIAALDCGKASEILSAFRAALLAKIAQLRYTGGPGDQEIAEALEHEIAALDQDLARRARLLN